MTQRIDITYFRKKKVSCGLKFPVNYCVERIMALVVNQTVVPLYIRARYPNHFICTECIRFRDNVIRHTGSRYFTCRWCLASVTDTHHKILKHMKICGQRPLEYNQYQCCCYLVYMRQRMEEAQLPLSLPISTWQPPQCSEDWD